MKTFPIERIDLSKLSNAMRKYEHQWIAVSKDNVIVSSGATYGEALGKAKSDEVILFKVPPLDVSFAP